MARWRGCALAATALLLAGCSLLVPSDPEGTLDRVDGGTLRVGVTHNPPWTEVGDAAEPAGSEVELAREFAAEWDADVAWSIGSEEALVGDLERGDLDLVIGGITDETPWAEQAAMTVPYAEADGPDGRPERHVMLTRLGENRFLFELERFLLDEGEAP
jgi:ABC-type amino acid transport substrate-binding protein